MEGYWDREVLGCLVRYWDGNGGALGYYDARILEWCDICEPRTEQYSLIQTLYKFED